MAYWANIDNVSKDLQKIVSEHLTMRPKCGFIQAKQGKPPEPFNFFSLEGNILKIPYMYAAGLFGIIPNADIEHKRININFVGTLREKQIPVYNEASQYIKKRGTVTLGLYPGFGKTILGAKLGADAGRLICVLVHRTKLLEQWLKTFTDNTNAKCWIVPEGQEAEPHEDIDVILCMDSRYNKIPSELRSKVGTLIVDEAHAFCTPCHVQCLLAFQPYYIIIESATLERDDDMHEMMYFLAGEHGIIRETDEPFKVRKVNTFLTIQRETRNIWGVGAVTDYSNMTKQIIASEYRNELILSIVRYHFMDTILILVLETEHADTLYNLIKPWQQSIDFMYGRKNDYEDGRVLIGTTSKIGTGFDQANSCTNFSGRPFNVGIIAFSIKKYSILVQNVGRMFRSKDPIIYHFVDDDPIYDKHWKFCATWYTKHRGVVEEFVPKLDFRK